MLDKSIPYIGVIMVKTDTANYPRYELPDGFAFKGYQPGDEEKWAKLIFDSGLTGTLKEAEDIFEREFLKLPELLPKQCIFVVDDDGKAAATASLWPGEHFGKTLQRVHWVAASPDYQGKGLAKALMTKVMDVYNELGYKDFIYLATQTWSYKAINIYSQFGFVPYMGQKPVNWKADNYEENNRLAWKMIKEKLAGYGTANKLPSSSEK
ncbi:GNAT family N-acetyltransferase [Pseudoclostridium thermosuccinogenes]|jgi:GNAT superfamily N-acetyltransferase|uniref:GNAT family N-acetyltransferase n=1 Tax=Clostridium thermosuccinogenes TaxID=84032 RepID=UPI000CCC1401|nr:GNAT family N-acetyltransferase [Pseudoclostridium thermosuccinogenes]PNT92300.1 hypothetical protein CDQ83_01610 [Pseudoclostridium thermosuccinogenes]